MDVRARMSSVVLMGALAAGSAQAASVCVAATPFEPHGMDEYGRHPLPVGRYVFRVDGRATLVVRRDAPVRLDGLSAGRHTVALLINGRRSVAMQIRLRANESVGLRPDNYDGPQIALAACDGVSHPLHALARRHRR